MHMMGLVVPANSDGLLLRKRPKKRKDTKSSSKTIVKHSANESEMACFFSTYSRIDMEPLDGFGMELVEPSLGVNIDDGAVSEARKESSS
ncbi:hypothetical protein L6452_34306 [Arctium lappa]|uniref:Uncharacterized protein n=1 Tax=Arctium lappa TaxID=4217 RepID=A0ACB8YIF8_ARCLA|nr:hypothetical protein L6452_34306 [Arctium lappa]